ncbi:AbiV family abortive infection protein [Sphingomonas sp. Leaf30]|uniref:AbiV family abortive infection protein n=1 Tax=Sphingomonas sp. Leaf30 TaxID=1736213 RepID=UPI0009EBB133
MSSAKLVTVPPLVGGMVAYRENARELLEEADILAKEGRHSRAFALPYTACEPRPIFAR